MQADSAATRSCWLIPTRCIYYVGVEQRVDMLRVPGETHGALGTTTIIIHLDTPPLDIPFLIELHNLLRFHISLQSTTNSMCGR